MFLGDLSVENFFKEVALSSGCTGENTFVPIIDNILVRLEAVQLSRAVMTLAGSLEVQVLILLTTQLSTILTSYNAYLKDQLTTTSVIKK